MFCSYQCINMGLLIIQSLLSFLFCGFSIYLYLSIMPSISSTDIHDKFINTVYAGMQKTVIKLRKIIRTKQSRAPSGAY